MAAFRVETRGDRREAEVYHPPRGNSTAVVAPLPDTMEVLRVNKRRLMIGLLALAGFACERQSDGPSASTAPVTAPAAQADGLDARETRLVMLKLPAMV